MEKKIEIPEEMQQICRELAEVAKRNKLYELSGTFTAPTNWGGNISFGWKSGRHEEESNQLTITSSFIVHTKINQSKS